MSGRQRSTIAGRVDFTAMLLRDRRVTIRAYLPTDYDWSSAENRVIYMLDAHTCNAGHEGLGKMFR